jgi:hypothetical protein
MRRGVIAVKARRNVGLADRDGPHSTSSHSGEAALPPSPPPKRPGEHRALRGLQRVLDDFVIARSKSSERRRAASSADRMRQVTKTAAFQTILASTLKGERGDQISWIDEPLRHYAIRRTNELFGDDIQWFRLVANAIYLLDPQSIAEIDRIVEEHVESRAGAFARELHEGRGWDPSRAIFFNQDAHLYARAYSVTAKTGWSAIEFPLSPDVITNIGNSGFDVSGRRGCVSQLTLRHSVDARDAEAFRDTFRRRSRALTTNALRDFVPAALSAAIIRGDTFDQEFGPIRVRFRTEFLSSTREGGSAACAFWLVFEHS